MYEICGVGKVFFHLLAIISEQKPTRIEEMWAELKKKKDKKTRQIVCKCTRTDTAYNINTINKVYNNNKQKNIILSIQSYLNYCRNLQKIKHKFGL